MKNKQYFKTTDIILATSILLLCPRINFKIEKEGERAHFIISLTPKTILIIKKAHLRTLKVEVYAFNAQLRLIKGMIKDQA